MDKVNFSVVSWVSIYPLFKDIPLSSIIRNQEEVSFSYLLDQQLQPRWIPPPLGLLKLNFIGSAVGNPGLARVGGIFHDSEARVFLSFSGLGRTCSVSKVEKLAMSSGLHEASRLGIRHLQVDAADGSS